MSSNRFLVIQLEDEKDAVGLTEQIMLWYSQPNDVSSLYPPEPEPIYKSILESIEDKMCWVVWDNEDKELAGFSMWSFSSPWYTKKRVISNFSVYIRPKYRKYKFLFTNFISLARDRARLEPDRPKVLFETDVPRGRDKTWFRWMNTLGRVTGISGEISDG